MLKNHFGRNRQGTLLSMPQELAVSFNILVFGSVGGTLESVP
jgi:hypothetical protein